MLARDIPGIPVIVDPNEPLEPICEMLLRKERERCEGFLEMCKEFFAQFDKGENVNA